MEDRTSANGIREPEVEAYCFRCKMRKVMHTSTETRMKNGRRAYTGTCVTCGTRMFKIAPLESPASTSTAFPSTDG